MITAKEAYVATYQTIHDSDEVCEISKKIEEATRNGVFSIELPSISVKAINYVESVGFITDYKFYDDGYFYEVKISWRH